MKKDRGRSNSNKRLGEDQEVDLSKNEGGGKMVMKMKM